MARAKHVSNRPTLPEPAADLLCAQGVDDGGLANIRVANKANADVLLVSAQAGKLAQQAQQAALAKRVGDASVKRQARVLPAQVP